MSSMKGTPVLAVLIRHESGAVEVHVHPDHFPRIVGWPEWRSVQKPGSDPAEFETKLFGVPVRLVIDKSAPTEAA